MPWSPWSPSRRRHPGSWATTADMTSPASPTTARLDQEVGPTPPITPDRHTLATAALANLDIQSFLADPQLGRIWTEESFRPAHSTTSSRPPRPADQVT